MFLDVPLAEGSLKTAILVSLLSVWVLVGLFQYLNRYTQRHYFGTWTAGWLFYALFLTISIAVVDIAPNPLLMMCKNWCIATAAVLMFWGSFQFLKLTSPQRLIGIVLLFVTVWSYASAYEFPGALWLHVPAFVLLAGASGFTAVSFFLDRDRRRYLGAGLLTFGFGLWALYLLSYPFLQAPSTLVQLGFLMAGVLQLFIAISMIILVLEEVRENMAQAEKEALKEKNTAEFFRADAARKQERYQNLFENASDAIVIASGERPQIVEMNQAARTLLRTPPTAVDTLVSSHFQLVNPDAPAGGSAFLEALAQSAECDVIRADGSQTRVQVRGGKLAGHGEDIYQFFFTELTQRTRLEKQLRQAEKLSAIGQMISGVAHELNNPLAAIKGYTDLLLLTHDLDTKTRGALIKVSQESHRAGKLVQNFLAFARPEEPKFEPVRIHELIQAIVAPRAEELQSKGISLSLHLSDRNPYIHGNADHLQQVLLNLINNAIQAMEGIEGERTLLITSRVHDMRLQLRIEDTGPGISDDVLPHLFEPFFTTRPLGEGTGLGLSICYSIVLTHKGRIFYETRPTGGARFTVDLPVAPEPSSEAVPAEPAVTPFTGEGNTGNGLKVLVVDDEVTIASLLKEMLAILGHNATVYNHPEHALAALIEESFDLVISDFRMPGMTGGALYEKAVAINPRLASRFIFLTGDMVNDETKTFFERNKVTVLLKPFQFGTIETAVAEALKPRAAELAA